MFTLKDLFSILSGKLFTMFFGDGEEGGGDGGNGGGDNKPDEATQKLIDAAVEKAVAGLKTKNTELLGSLRDAKDNLKKFEGIDPDAVNAMLKRFADDEEAGLIKEGRIDEVLNKRTERMQGDFQKKLDAAAADIKRAGEANKKLADRALSAAILGAATKAGALPEAMDDFILRARGVFKVNEDGDVVAMDGDNVLMGKDGKTPLSAIEWAESLKETAPHLWPKGTGTNAPGSGGNGGKQQGNFGGNKAERTAAIASKFPSLEKS